MIPTLCYDYKIATLYYSYVIPILILTLFLLLTKLLTTIYYVYPIKLLLIL